MDKKAVAMDDLQKKGKVIAGYSLEREASLKGYEIFNNIKEGVEVAKGISFSVIGYDKDGLPFYPLLKLQKIVLPDKLIKFLFEHLKS